MEQVKNEVAQLIADVDAQYTTVQALAQAASKDTRRQQRQSYNVKDIKCKSRCA